MKLFIINQQDDNLLQTLSESEGDILLMQNAAYYLNKNFGDRTKITNLTEKGRKVFDLESDVTKRGILDKLIEGVELLSYDKLLDVLFSGYTVLNM